MAEADLRNMVMNFRVSDLQLLLGFAGRNKTGKKQELQARALDLTKLRSPAVEMKIKELHSRRYHNQLTGRPANYDIPDRALTDCVTNYEPAMNSNYSARPNPNVRPMSINQAPNPYYSKPYLQPIPPTHPPNYSSYIDVKLKDLPFYDVLHVLLKPFSLSSDLLDRNKETNYSFTLLPQQAHDLAVSKDGSGNYECQILLRFCIQDSSGEQEDNFPPNLNIKVNNKNVPLPNVVPTNRPGVEPKRPSKPVNLTPFAKLSPTVTNTITVSWASTYGRSYAAELTIAKVVTSYALLQRLKSRGVRAAEYTKAMIIDKLQQDQDADIATTSLQASLICPLGKLKMEFPCRSVTCSHIACFDASLYIQLNEKKAKWRCPVCDKPALFKNLMLDGLFMEIVSQVSIECTDVQLHEDGSWTPIVPVKKIKETKKLETEETMKEPAKSVELVDISSDSDTEELWKDNTIYLPSADSPPVVFIPPAQCPTPPLTVFSPGSSMYSSEIELQNNHNEPVPVCLTSNVPSELPSSEHLNVLPDIPVTESLLPSASNSVLGSTVYNPFIPSDTTYCANATNPFSEPITSDDKQIPDKFFDFYSLLVPPTASEQQKYQKDFVDKDLSEKDSNHTPDIISLE